MRHGRAQQAHQRTEQLTDEGIVNTLSSRSGCEKGRTIKLCGLMTTTLTTTTTTKGNPAADARQRTCTMRERRAHIVAAICANHELARTDPTSAGRQGLEHDWPGCAWDRVIATDTRGTGRTSAPSAIQVLDPDITKEACMPDIRQQLLPSSQRRGGGRFVISRCQGPAQDKATGPCRAEDGIQGTGVRRLVRGPGYHGLGQKERRSRRLGQRTQIETRRRALDGQR